jgi:intracellular multiplication protein IcmT
MSDDYPSWHWRNTMKPVRFFQFDARSVIFLLLVLVHARLWTLYLLIGVNIIFWILERRGLSFAAALRALRLWFTGPYRPAWVYTRRRKFHDTGSS